MMKKYFSIALGLVLLLSTLSIAAYAAKPASGDIIRPDYISGDALSVTQAGNGTNIRFTGSYNAGIRAASTKGYVLDGLSITYTDINVANSKVISLAVGNSSGAWYDSNCIMVFMMTDSNQVIVSKQNQTDQALAYTTLTTASLTTGTITLAFNKVDASKYTLTVNGESIDVNATALESMITDLSSVYLSFGNWQWSAPTGDLSYTISDISEASQSSSSDSSSGSSSSDASSASSNPYTVEIGTPNVSAADFADTWGTISGGIQATAKGVSIAPAGFGSRATFLKAYGVDGLTIKLTDIQVSGLDGNENAFLAFTLTRTEGDFTQGGVGAFVRLNVNAAGEVSAYIKAASDTDDAGDDIYLPMTRLSTFNGLPSDVEITFTKNGSNYDISFNGEVVSVAAANLEAGLFADDLTGFISFGGWGDGSTIAYTVNYVSSPVLRGAVTSNPASSNASSQTSDSDSSTKTDSDDDTDVPDTGDRTGLALIVLLAVLSGGTAVAVRRKQK